MGDGFITECKSCMNVESVFLGIGFSYPRLCDEILDKMRKGKFGKEYKKILRENPNCKIDCEYVIFSCKDCNKWYRGMKLDLYKGDKSNTNYLLGSKGELIKKFEHKCKYCNSENLEVMHNITKKLRCNKCGGRLEVNNNICWD